MLFAERDENGKITAIRNSAESTDGQKLTEKEIAEFLSQSGDASSYQNALALLDSGLVRVLDDLIDILVSKNVIMLTDLPEGAQNKIGERKKIRQKMHEVNELMVDDIL